MSLTISFTLRDDVTPFVHRVRTDIRPNRTMHRYMADEARAEVRSNFAILAGEEHNAMGAPSSGFWQRMIDGTVALSTEEAAIVRMPREIAQRFYGGPISPIAGKYLAIPARTEAYNKSPRQFDDLRFVPLGPGRGMLVQRAQTQLTPFKSGKRKGQIKSVEETGGGVFYWLVSGVTQRPNPRVLPANEVLGAAALRGFGTYLQTLV